MTARSHNGDTFVTKKVTNNDIYDLVETLNKRVPRDLTERLGAIEAQTTRTNGSVRVLKVNVKGLWAMIAGMIGVLTYLVTLHIVR
jgi:hypothetical protein